jgi:hypothetical protein
VERHVKLQSSVGTLAILFVLFRRAVRRAKLAAYCAGMGLDIVKRVSKALDSLEMGPLRHGEMLTRCSKSSSLLRI